jgi:alkylhydroperoxidase family enzyme
MSTFLAPIEKPAALGIKLAYYFSKRQFGKVLTPLTVFGARLPVAFGMFYGKVAKLDKQLSLPQETAMLIRERVARLNVCLFCIDIGRAATIAKKLDVAKFDALNDYQCSPLFNNAERAALDYVSELTTNKTASPAVFFEMKKHYTERQLCEIAFLVASEHLYNLTNIGLNIHSDMLCTPPNP